MEEPSNLLGSAWKQKAGWRKMLKIYIKTIWKAWLNRRKRRGGNAPALQQPWRVITLHGACWLDRDDLWRSMYPNRSHVHRAQFSCSYMIFMESLPILKRKKFCPISNLNFPRLGGGSTVTVGLKWWKEENLPLQLQHTNGSKRIKTVSFLIQSPHTAHCSS